MDKWIELVKALAPIMGPAGVVGLIYAWRRRHAEPTRQREISLRVKW